MRLYEIKEENRSIIALKRLSESYEAEFKELYTNLQMFKRLKGSRLNNFIESNVEPFRNKLREFISTKFYKDPDIDKIKRRLKEMLNALK